MRNYLSGDMLIDSLLLGNKFGLAQIGSGTSISYSYGLDVFKGNIGLEFNMPIALGNTSKLDGKIQPDDDAKLVFREGKLGDSSSEYSGRTSIWQQDGVIPNAPLNSFTNSNLVSNTNAEILIDDRLLIAADETLGGIGGSVAKICPLRFNI